MNEILKKYCVCGVLVLSTYATFCGKCLAKQPPDMPVVDYSGKASDITINTGYMIGISAQTGSTQGLGISAVIEKPRI